MDDLRVGYARVDTTPPLGCRMMGYAARKEGAVAVHDPLSAAALWLESGAARAVVVAHDLSSYDAEIVGELRAAIQAETGLADHEIILNTSHTHAGPSVVRVPDLPTVNLDYLRTLVERTAQVVVMARDDAAPATLRVGSAPLDIGGNRRQRQPDGTIKLGPNPTGPTLRELTLWAFDRPGRTAVGLFSVPMHGTTLGGRNLQLSAEWMGLARTFAEETLPNCRFLFAQGCGGDQNPYRTRDDFTEVEAHGQVAANALAQAWETAQSVTAAPLRTTLRICEGPVADGRLWPVPVAGLRLGEATLVGLGGEACVAYASFIRAHSPAASTLALGYTDGSVGYLPTAEILAEGGYEATANRMFRMQAVWQPEIEKRLQEAVIAVLAELTA